jgi:hypothetical protein
MCYYWGLSFVRNIRGYNINRILNKSRLPPIDIFLANTAPLPSYFQLYTKIDVNTSVAVMLHYVVR